MLPIMLTILMRLNNIFVSSYFLRYVFILKTLYAIVAKMIISSIIIESSLPIFPLLNNQYKRRIKIVVSSIEKNAYLTAIISLCFICFLFDVNIICISFYISIHSSSISFILSFASCIHAFSRKHLLEYNFQSFQQTGSYISIQASSAFFNCTTVHSL